MEFSRSLDPTLPPPQLLSSPLAHRLFAWARPIAERVLLISRIRKACRLLPPPQADGSVAERLLDRLHVSIQTDVHDIQAIPRTGPLVVVSNHPFGAIDGLALAMILQSVRPDFKILVNHLLRILPLPELQDHLIYVDPFGSRQAKRANIKPLREALRWIQAGNTLVIFPAGEVSHLQCHQRAITDPPWIDTVARLVRKARASVLPVYFEGANSVLFQVVGLIHPRLRTLMLPRELLKKRSQTVTVRIGRPIPFERLQRFENEANMTQYLRLKTYILGTRKNLPSTQASIPGQPRTPSHTIPVAPPAPKGQVLADIDALGPRHILVDTPKHTVYQASFEEIPTLMREIGRLREITFRGAGEGTGKAIDLDRFDEHYTQLFLWSKEEEEIIGGYRLGLSGEILDRFGPEGFYTSTLFAYGREFLDHIHPAIELGRSFVVPRHQKSYQPLMLLWRGIGEFISSRPEYASLFGPVSITQGYHVLSREFMVKFCQRKRPSYLSSLVRPKHPPRWRGGRLREMEAACRLIEDVQDLSELVSEIEPDQKGIPILLRHYMKLGAEFLGFSEDPLFSDVLDALILVDLTRTEGKVLERYMGRANALSFLAFHLDRNRAATVCA